MNAMTDTYTTPEGFTLARPLLLPDARSFSDVLEYVREWDHATMSHTSGVVPHPESRPEPAKIGDNEIGPFRSIRLADSRRSIAVRATQAVLDAVAQRIVTPDDHLSFQIIEHKANGRALVILEHGYIIGSHWLAYIDPATIPAPLVESGPDVTKPVETPPHFGANCAVCGRRVVSNREPIFPGDKPWTYRCETHKVSAS